MRNKGNATKNSEKKTATESFGKDWGTGTFEPTGIADSNDLSKEPMNTQYAHYSNVPNQTAKKKVTSKLH